MVDFTSKFDKNSWTARIAESFSGKVGTEDLVLEMRTFQANPELVTMPHIRSFYASNF